MFVHTPPTGNLFLYVLQGLQRIGVDTLGVENSKTIYFYKWFHMHVDVLLE